MLAFFPSLFFYFMSHRQAHIIYLNYMIIFQDVDFFPASKVGKVEGEGDLVYKHKQK